MCAHACGYASFATDADAIAECEDPNAGEWYDSQVTSLLCGSEKNNNKENTWVVVIRPDFLWCISFLGCVQIRGVC